MGGFIGILQCDLRLREATSLKDKRRTVAGVRSGLTRGFGAAVAEVGHHDLRQRAEVTAALVDRSPHPLEERLDAIERWLERQPVETTIVRRRRLIATEDLD